MSESSESTHDPVVARDAVARDRDIYNARMLAIRELRDYTQHIVGGVLGVIDAIGLPPKQFEAVKRLLHRELWDAHYQKALEWAERQEQIEWEAFVEWGRRNASDPSCGDDPHPERPLSWKDVVTERYIGEKAWNVFPFSRSGPDPE